MDLFAFRTTAKGETVMQQPEGTAEFEDASEYGVPAALRAETALLPMGYTFRWTDLATKYTQPGADLTAAPAVCVRRAVRAEPYAADMRERIGMADLSALQPYVDAFKRVTDQVDQLEGHHPNATNEFTARFFDQNQVAGHRPYIEASSHLANAVEHSDALWSLALSEDFGLTPRVPWSLLRSVFESGFWASWVLDPEDSYTRRCRGLRLSMVDEREHKAWFAELPLPADVRSIATDRNGVDKVHRDECHQLKIPWSKESRSRPPLVQEVKRLAFTRGDELVMGMMAATWRSLSGSQHALPWAILRNSDMPRKVQTDGGYSVQISVNDDAFVMAARSAYGLAINGAQLYVRRTTELIRTS